MQHIGPSLKTQISLLPGQSHFAQLRRGDVIDVTRGSVLIVTKVYLDHDAIVQKTVVRRGAIYRVPVSGAFAIEAQCAVTMALAIPTRRGGIGRLQHVLPRQLLASLRSIFSFRMPRWGKAPA
jgi:hypothetical protein